MDKLLDRTDLSELARAVPSGALLVLLAGLWRDGALLAVDGSNYAVVVLIAIGALMLGWVCNVLAEWGTAKWHLSEQLQNGFEHGTIGASIVERHGHNWLVRLLMWILFGMPACRFAEVLSRVRLGMALRIGQGEYSAFTCIESPFESTGIYISLISDVLVKSRPALLADLVRAHDRLMLSLSSSVVLSFFSVCMLLRHGYRSLHHEVSTDLWTPLVAFVIALGLRYVARNFWERETILAAEVLDISMSPPQQATN